MASNPKAAAQIDDGRRQTLAYAMLNVEVKDESLRPKVVGAIDTILEEFRTILADPGRCKGVSYSEILTTRRISAKRRLMPDGPKETPGTAKTFPTSTTC